MKTAFFLFAAFFLAYNSPLQAQEISEAKLALIAEFAERLCTEVPLQGERHEISGSVEAELKGIVRRLMGAGVEGAADFDVTNYAGFAQEQLLEAVRSSVECRLVIWNDLEKKMFPTDASSSFPCEPPGGLSGNNIERAVLLINLGVEHARREEYREAVSCFEQPLRFHESESTLQNVAWAHWKWEDGDREKAIEYMDRAVSIQRKSLRNIDVGMIKTLQDNPMGGDCRWRAALTNEVVSTVVWHNRALMHVESGESEKALTDYLEVIREYPPESCVYVSRVGRALWDRGLLNCSLGQMSEAASDLVRAAEIGYLEDTAVAKQEALRDGGYYKGAADGVVGKGTIAAFKAYALDGCPEKLPDAIDVIR